MKKYKITQKELEQAILNKDSKFSKEELDYIKSLNLSYYKLSLKERDKVLHTIVKRIIEKDFWVSGEDKISVWNRGWKENLNLYLKSKNKYYLRPKFLKKYPLRWRDDWINPISKNFEFDFFDVYRRNKFNNYFKNLDNIYEFGCGSAQHLILLSKFFKTKQIYGLDWSNFSIKIINQINKFNQKPIFPKKFNLFKPDYGLKLQPKSAVFTVGTMEQLGKNYKPFLKYLAKNKPSVVLHFETIDYFYDQSTLHGYLGHRWGKERNYLSGYYDTLLKLKKNKKIKILEIKKFPLGSMYHNSYSLIVWRPI